MGNDPYYSVDRFAGFLCSFLSLQDFGDSDS